VTVATITARRTHGKPGKVTVTFDPTGPAKAHQTTK
jgi:ribosomal protein L35AE/L33A